MQCVQPNLWSRLDQRQIKAEIISSGSALPGSAPTPAHCWCRAVTRPSRSHSSGTCCWRTHVELWMSNSDFNCNKWSRYVIIQIFGERIITCHRCHCCFVSPFVPRQANPDTWKEQEVPLCSCTPDLSNQLAALPSHESLRLCLKAVHLLLWGSAAVGECACVQVGLWLRARECWVWEVAENMWFVVLLLLTSRLPEV